MDSPTTEPSLAKCVPFLKALALSVAVLEADAAPLSSAVGIFSALRLCLDQLFAELPVAARSSIQGSLGRRFSLIQDPLLVLAFYLDTFWCPVRQRVAAMQWDGTTLPTLRGRAVEFLAGDDASYSLRISRDLAAFLTYAEQLPLAFAGRDLHPAQWWVLVGEPFPTLRVVALRLFALPPSAAGGERAFKTVKLVHTAVRNRLDPAKADMQTRIMFNSAQLARADIIASYGRSCAEHMLLERLGMSAVDQAPPAPPAPADGTEGAGEEDYAGDIEEVAPAAFDAIVEGVVNGDGNE